MNGLEFLRETINRPDRGKQVLLELLPELATVSENVIRINSGDLFDAAECRKKCNGCKDFSNCWRVGDAKGFVTTVQVIGETLNIQYPQCRPYKAHQAAEKQRQLLSQTGMSNQDRTFTFANYPQEQERKHSKIMRHAMSFAETISTDTTMQGLYLFGPPGIGKTHLMLAVINRVLERGISAIYTRHDMMMDKLRDASRGEAGELEDVIERYINVPVLGIDEFAQERMTDFALDKTIEIINARTTKRLPTWFTSNFAPTEVFERLYSVRPEQIDALRSRIYVLSLAARMTGEDNRMTNLYNALGPDEEAND